MITLPINSGFSKRKPHFTFAIVVLITLFLLLPQLAAAQLLDRIVGVVNDDIITLSELEEEGKDFLEMVREKTPRESREQALADARSKVLDKLIDQHLINQKAAEANIKISDKEFEITYKRKIESMKLSPDQFRQKLKKSGLSEENYRSNLRNQLLRDKLILYEVRSKIIITEEMIVNYYESEYTEKLEGGAYYILQMGFSFGDSDEVKQSAELLEADKVRARKRAEEAHLNVTDGADFKAVAKEKSELPSASDGGDIGLFQLDEMAVNMRQEILPLKPGEISQILETSNNFQFFKLLSSKEGAIVHQAPYDSVKDEIHKKLFEDKMDKEFKNWVTNIKENSYIKKMLF